MHSSNRTQTQTPAVPATPSFQDRHGQLHRSFARIARPEAAAERAGTSTSQRVASFLLASSLALGLPLATLPLGAHAAPAAPVAQLAPQAQDDGREARQPGAGPEGRAKPGRGMEGRGEHHRRGPGGPGGPGHLRGLQLSDAQQDQVFAIRHASAPELRQQYRAARQAEQQLRELSRADTFDAARAQTLSQQAAQAQAAASLQMARDQHAIRAVLTPEQRTQLDTRRTQHADAGPPPPRGERGAWGERGDRGERGAPRPGAEPPHAEPARAEPSR